MTARMTSLLWAAALVALTAIADTAVAAADTLVVKDGDKYKAAAAASWTVEGDTVLFALAEGVDAEETAATLRERLSAATVAVVDGKIKVSGVPSEALLDQLSALSLSGEGGDPLAELAGLGGAVDMDTPEGGGSIRATNPTGLAPPRVIDQHNPKERFTAEVVSVTRQAFPTVVLKLKLKSSARGGPLRKALRKGKVIEAVVVVETQSGAVNYDAANTQRNIGAYYLTTGDRVVAHAVAAGKRLELDFVEREAAK